MSGIVSFSLWGNDPHYNQGAIANAQAAVTVYPGWRCRFYCDPEAPAWERLRELGCELIPMTPLGWQGLFWRFLAASDDSAEYAIIRDTDSLVNAREAAAVREWIESGRGLHTMQDSDQHISVPILGGMWGIRRGRMPDIASSIKEWLAGEVPRGRGPDQAFLQEVVWPRFPGDHLGHVRADLLPRVHAASAVRSYRAFPDVAAGDQARFVGAALDAPTNDQGARGDGNGDAEGQRVYSELAGRDLSVWYVFPSCNPARAERACRAWRERGYRTAVLLDYGLPTVGADIELYESPYQGYYRSANRLCRLAVGRGAEIVVAGGDDMLPDPTRTAAEIGGEFRERFPNGYGVMQPIGDDLDGTDRICGSPWLGRTFILRSYGGRGPYWAEYGHFFGDQELHEIARAQDVLWQRRDLTQRHEHWTRAGSAGQTDYQLRNGNEHWHRDEALYHQRSAAGFPGHEPAEVLKRLMPTA
jgi:hypothetical protein